MTKTRTNIETRTYIQCALAGYSWTAATAKLHASMVRLTEVAQRPFGFLIDYSQVGEPTFIDAREHELDEQSDLRLQEFNLCTCLFFTLTAGAALMRVVTDLPLQKEQIGVYLIDDGKVL
jgi:hypothetical protein